MDTGSNTERVHAAEERLAHGDSAGWLAAFGDDVRWTVMGQTSWSGTYVGKDIVREELLGPLVARFASPYRRQVRRLLGDGDWVVAECRGEVVTTGGPRYDNDYCFLFRLVDGLIVEVVEYCDTALIDRVLGERIRSPE